MVLHVSTWIAVPLENRWRRETLSTLAVLPRITRRAAAMCARNGLRGASGDGWRDPVLTPTRRKLAARLVEPASRVRVHSCAVPACRISASHLGLSPIRSCTRALFSVCTTADGVPGDASDEAVMFLVTINSSERSLAAASGASSISGGRDARRALPKVNRTTWNMMQNS